MVLNYNKKNKFIQYDKNTIISNYTKKITIVKCNKRIILPNSIKKINLINYVDNYKLTIPNSVTYQILSPDNNNDDVPDEDEDEDDNFRHDKYQYYTHSNKLINIKRCTNKLCSAINIYTITHNNIKNIKNIFLFENIIQIVCNDSTNKIQKKIFSQLKSVQLLIGSNEKNIALLKNIYELYIEHDYEYTTFNKQIYLLKNIHKLNINDCSYSENYIVVDLSQLTTIYDITYRYTTNMLILIFNKISYTRILDITAPYINEKYLNKISCIHFLLLRDVNIDSDAIRLFKYVHNLSIQCCKHEYNISCLKNINTLTIFNVGNIKDILKLTNVKTLKIKSLRRNLRKNEYLKNKYLNNSVLIIENYIKYDVNNLQLTMFVKKIIMMPHNVSTQKMLSQIKTHGEQKFHYENKYYE